MDRVDRNDKKEPPLKKRKVGEEDDAGTEGGSICDVDADKMSQFRYEACNLLRGTYGDILNRGRTDVRARLFEEVLFLTERISKLPNAESAKEAGFFITFDEPNESESIVPSPDDLRTSIWWIENAKTSGGKLTNEVVHAHNNRILKAMQTKFPSLWITLHWKKKVQAPLQPVPEYRDDLYWPMTKRVSLQKVAVGVFLEIVKAGSPDAVLSSSPYSTKPVHVVAIGLGGLILLCTGKNLSDIESCALGDVGGHEDREGKHSVNVMIDTTPKKKLKSASRVEKIITKLFQMSWNEYKLEAERKRDELRRRMSVAPGLQAEEDVEDSEEDGDIFENT